MPTPTLTLNGPSSVRIGTPATFSGRISCVGDPTISLEGQDISIRFTGGGAAMVDITVHATTLSDGSYSAPLTFPALGGYMVRARWAPVSLSCVSGYSVFETCPTSWSNLNVACEGGRQTLTGTVCVPASPSLTALKVPAYTCGTLGVGSASRYLNTVAFPMSSTNFQPFVVFYDTGTKMVRSQSLGFPLAPWSGAVALINSTDFWALTNIYNIYDTPNRWFLYLDKWVNGVRTERYVLEDIDQAMYPYHNATTIDLRRLSDGSFFGAWKGPFNAQSGTWGTMKFGFIRISPSGTVGNKFYSSESMTGFFGTQDTIVQHPADNSLWLFTHKDGAHGVGHVRISGSLSAPTIMSESDSLSFSTVTPPIIPSTGKASDWHEIYGEIPPIASLATGGKIMLAFPSSQKYNSINGTDYDRISTPSILVDGSKEWLTTNFYMPWKTSMGIMQGSDGYVRMMFPASGLSGHYISTLVGGVWSSPVASGLGLGAILSAQDVFVTTAGGVAHILDFS